MWLIVLDDNGMPRMRDKIKLRCILKKMEIFHLLKCASNVKTILVMEEVVKKY